MHSRLFVIALAGLGACRFSAELPPDAPGPTITVGFEQGTSDVDEKTRMHSIKVKISDVSPVPVVVEYAIDSAAMNAATPVADFDLLSTATITIPVGQIEATLDIEVKPDVAVEDIETIDFVLSSATGAVIAASANKHRVQILANALPRVSFSGIDTMTEEGLDQALTVVLDEPSKFPITVAYTATSTNASSPEDYILASGTLTFAADDQAESLNLDIVDDMLDEDNETVVVTLSNPTNAFLGTRVAHAHTILDATDLPPIVQFAAATQTVAENAGTVNITVTLSGPSGKTITVPYAADAANSTATAGGTDFTVGAAVTITPGQTGGTATIAVNDDAIDEPTEVAEIDIGTPVNATLGAQANHRVSITDNDLVCYGPANTAFDVCLQDAPTNTVTIPGGTIDTDASSLCSTQTVDFGPGQDPACFIIGATVNITGSTVVTGSRRLVVVASSMLSITNTLDGSSKRGGSRGPGADSSSCASSGNGGNDQQGGGGGGGGSFMSAGANGGTGDNGDAGAGGAAMADAAAPAKLRGGCPGAKGGNNDGGIGGPGGGAIYLLSGDSMSFGTNAVINVSGGGGSGGATSAGGGGGGSGGMLYIYATNSLSTNNNTKLVANGGGGGAGGTNGAPGGGGNDPVPQTETTAAPGGTAGSGAGDGGNGFAGSTPPTVGGNGSNNNAGGGGGGGGGYIFSNRSLGQADTSAGVIAAP